MGIKEQYFIGFQRILLLHDPPHCRSQDYKDGRHLRSVYSHRIDQGLIMGAPKFIHDDIVTLTETGQVGTVKEVHEAGSAYVYGLELKTAACETVSVPEAGLALVKIANEDETGIHIRYIS